jgi:hypothetical protein
MSRRTCLIHPVSSVLPRIGGVLTLRFIMSRYPGSRFRRADGPEPWGRWDSRMAPRVREVNVPGTVLK